MKLFQSFQSQINFVIPYQLWKSSSFFRMAKIFTQQELQNFEAFPEKLLKMIDAKEMKSIKHRHQITNEYRNIRIINLNQKYEKRK